MGVGRWYASVCAAYWNAAPQACLPLEFALNGWYTESQRANDWDPPAAQEAAVAIIVHRNYLEAALSRHMTRPKRYCAAAVGQPSLNDSFVNFLLFLIAVTC